MPLAFLAADRDQGGAMATKRELDILSQTAHDMRSPLAVIAGFLEQVDTSQLDNDMREFCAAARRSADRLLAMADSLRRSSVVAHPNRAAHDVAEIVRACVAEIRRIADGNKVEVRYAGPRKLIGLVDKLLFERVLTNMLSNSLQALGKRGGWILITLLCRNGTIYLDVADNGIGIEPGHLDKIFERGFTHGDHNGTGIGLDACRQIIESLGGRIEVHSAKNSGAIFTTILPASALIIDEDADADARDIIVEGRDCAVIRRDDTLDPM